MRLAARLERTRSGWLCPPTSRPAPMEPTLLAQGALLQLLLPMPGRLRPIGVSDFLVLQ